MVEAINQSGACIFLGVNLQKFVRDEEDFFVRFLGINEFGYLIAERTRKVRI